MNDTVIKPPVTTTPARPQTATVPYTHMRIIGKVIERKKTRDGKAKIVIAVPAPDQYSHPTTYEISADSPFASIDDIVDVQVHVTSFGKTFTSKPDQFGEVTKGRTYIFFLNYVDHVKVS